MAGGMRAPSEPRVEVSIRFSPEEHARLGELARAHYRSVAAEIRMACKTWMAAHPPEYAEPEHAEPEDTEPEES